MSKRFDTLSLPPTVVIDQLPKGTKVQTGPVDTGTLAAILFHLARAWRNELQVLGRVRP